MPVEALFCPNCGAPLQLVGNQCAFCDVIVNVTPPAAPPSAPAPIAPPPGLAPADPDAAFAMMVQDVFSIRKRGTVVTGRIESGVIRVGDHVVIEGSAGAVQAECSGVEMFRKQVDAGHAGDVVGLLFKSLGKDDVATGDRCRLAT